MIRRQLSVTYAIGGIWFVSIELAVKLRLGLATAREQFRVFLSLSAGENPGVIETSRETGPDGYPTHGTRDLLTQMSKSADRRPTDRPSFRHLWRGNGWGRLL